MKQFWIHLVCLTALAGATAVAGAQDTTPAGVPLTTSLPPSDYKLDVSWLCRPGHEGPCMQDQTATRVAADGKLTPEPFQAASNPPVDCFYVYPTVSYQQTANSDMTLGPEERVVANLQVARFASRCRIFAPLYRQATLYSLVAAGQGLNVHPDFRLAYEDVRAAWRDYLARDNHGRGVILIGHSQGSAMLLQLLKDEFDGKPAAQARLVSAILPGVNLPVPAGADAGGALKTIPLCRRTGQTGCVVAYSSFRATSPPPENTRYGKVPGGMVDACVNPAALAGGSAILHAYFPTDYKDPGASTPLTPEWVKGVKIPTPFVTTPGLLSGECVSNEHGSYLAITLHSLPTDRRTQDIGGDVSINGTILKEWGLHLIDVSLTQGDLITMAGQQTAAYSAHGASSTP